MISGELTIFQISTYVGFDVLVLDVECLLTGSHKIQIFAGVEHTYVLPDVDAKDRYVS